LILCIAPDIRAFSLQGLEKQWSHWRRKERMLPLKTVPIWAFRLLLWQIIVLYSASLTYKLLGDMWIAGSAPAATLHHPQFARFPVGWMDELAPLSPIFGITLLLEHVGWVSLLVPWISNRFPLKRLLIGLGIVLHGGIFILLDAGSFSPAIFAAYAGLLIKEDFDWIRKVFVSPRKKVTVFYDGRCGLCQRSIFLLKVLDSLHRIIPINFWDAPARKRTAPDLAVKDLDRAMHVRSSDKRTTSGFYGFRTLAWHLPVLWIGLPILYIPGVPFIGKKIYSVIANRRKRCSHASCAL
jgi:predicted DCC family thiol-disulfide oxidoreductase YuxK